MYRAGFHSKKDLAKYLGLSERTIRRYVYGHSKPPVAIIRLLTILSGDIGQISSHFNGWTIKGRIITSSNGEQFDYNRLEYIRTEFSGNRINLNTIKELEAENTALKKALPKCQVTHIKTGQKTTKIS